MNREEFEHLKSDLTEHLTLVIQDQIKITVNGKIDSLRKEIGPVVEIFNNLRWGEKVLMKIGIFAGGLVTFAIGVVELFRLIKK